MPTQEIRATGGRLALVNGALVLFSLVITGLLVLAAGEVFFRIKFNAAIDQTAETSLFEFDGQRGWRLKPGEYSRFNFGSHRVVDVSINDWGLRDRPLSAEVPAGKERISVLGDSFVFAEALNVPNQFTARLQDLAGPEYEIVNMSVPGYGTGQQFRMLEDLVSRGFQVGGKVILVFFTNDIQDNLGQSYSSLKADPLKPRFAVDEAGNLQSVSPKETKKGREGKNFWKRSLFFNFLKGRIEIAAARYPAIFVALDTVGLAPAVPRTPGIIAGWYGDGWEERWAATRDILEYVSNYVRTRLTGTELQIAFVPSPLQVENVFQVMISRNLDADPRYAEFFGDIDRAQNRLRAFADEQNIAFIDMTSALRETSATYFPSEGHLNELGSQIAAQVLYDRAFKGE